jgi:tRNA-dependent cyclodipeptide synthase
MPVANTLFLREPTSLPVVLEELAMLPLSCGPRLDSLAREYAERPTRYRAKIDKVSPQAKRATFEKEFEECFVGVSLENGNFTQPKLHAILEWVSRRFPRCTVLVGDSIHRITLETTKLLPPNVATQEALRLGKLFVDEMAPVFDEFRSQTEFTFVTCNEIQTSSEYFDLHARLRALFLRDQAFRSSVERFGRTYHGKHSQDVSEAERARRIDRSSDYFLEEFAIFSCLRRRGIGVMVYPGSFSTLAEIAEGVHVGAVQELRDLVVVSLHMRGR